VGTMSEGCDLLEQSTGFLVGYPRAPFASVVTTLALGLPCVSSPSETHRRYSGGPSWVRGAGAPDCSGTMWSGDPPRDVSGGPSPGPPQNGGSGPPKKGGCRDTKQCKFWRVSSVLIQGLFCFLGVRGGLRGGPPGGRFWGVCQGGSQRPGPWGNPLGSSGPGEHPLQPGDPDQEDLGQSQVPASYLRWRCTCWGTQRERPVF
jgi:hypothetical protein